MSNFLLLRSLNIGRKSIRLILFFVVLIGNVTNAHGIVPTENNGIAGISQITQTNNERPSLITKSRTQHFAEGNVPAYVWSLISPYFSYSRLGYIAAILIFLIYLFYFRYIDIYEHEPWKYILFTFLGGIVFADIGLIFYDAAYVFLGLGMNDDFLNDLFYCIFVIGGIEEFVKIVPLLLILRYTKVINEPVDYIVYGGVSALGFAFSENVMYFDTHGIGIIFSRALTAVAFHTSLTAIVAYGLVLRDVRKKKNAHIRLFFVAIVLHGLYDFFLINPTARSLIIISYLILFATITVFNSIISNTLSNSPFYNKGVHLEIKKIQTLLIGGLVGVFVLQYLLLLISESAEAANNGLKSSLLIGAIMIPALSMRFGNIHLHPRKWKSIQIPFLWTKISLDKNEDDYVNLYIEMHAMSRNRLMSDYFPNNGQIYKQQDDKKNRRWFYVRLERHGHHPAFNNAHIVIRSKFGNVLINEKSGLGMAGVYLINKQTNKPEFIGWISVKEIPN